jgi:serine/threonine-protein kinase HipA
MAKACGVAMPRTRLLAPKGNHRGYFAIERFDRRGPHRVHTHTVCGLLEAPPLSTTITYEQILNLTRELTRDAREVVQMFRRAAFNVYAHNRDDHSRNFAFAMESDGTWKLAPAYDLTFSDGPAGEHHMLVAGEGSSPTREHNHYRANDLANGVGEVPIHPNPTRSLS